MRRRPSISALHRLFEPRPTIDEVFCQRLALANYAVVPVVNLNWVLWPSHV